MGTLVPEVRTENLPAETTLKPAIHTVDLAKSFGSTAALNRLSVTVAKGEAFGFLGPNGAGKTTAVKLLVGLSTPTAGEGWVLGAPLGDVETRTRIGYLPELFRYQDWLTGCEVLDFQCKLARIPRTQRPGQIDRALEISGLHERGKDRVGTYSKGMQQRLGLGVALLGSPEVVFLDEPTSALDPVGRHDVREIIRVLTTSGVTVFLNSHLLTEVEQVCDRVAVVDRGRVIAAGTLDELRGKGSMVRIRATGIDQTIMSALEKYGSVELEGGELVVDGLPEDRIPDVVAEMVRRGADIYSVHSGGGTLEESFLALLDKDRAPNGVSDGLTSQNPDGRS